MLRKAASTLSWDNRAAGLGANPLHSSAGMGRNPLKKASPPDTVHLGATPELPPALPETPRDEGTWDRGQRHHLALLWPPGSTALGHHGPQQSEQTQTKLAQMCVYIEQSNSSIRPLHSTSQII